ncbi:hypothetical protein ACHAXR_001469 [Thalassiosira sp. AJA248-18]
MLDVLEKLGAPPKLRDAIKRLYTNLKVILKIGKGKAEITQSVGVRQGDNLSPVIFLFLMTAFVETLEAEWTVTGLAKAKFCQASMTSTEEFSKGQLISHNKHQLDKGDIFHILQILYVDDGAFIFNSRGEMIKGLVLINRVFKKIGLEMHLGKEDVSSKTEVMYIPTTAFYVEPEVETLQAPNQQAMQLGPADDTVDDDDNNLPSILPPSTTPTRKKKHTMSTMSQKTREKLYKNSPLTNRAYLNDVIWWISLPTSNISDPMYLSTELTTTISSTA